MNKLATFLILAVALSILKAVLVALVVSLGLALMFSFITRPRETVAFVAILGLIGLASAQPTAFIITLGILGMAVVMARSRQKSPRPPLLIDGPRRH